MFIDKYHNLFSKKIMPFKEFFFSLLFLFFQITGLINVINSMNL